MKALLFLMLIASSALANDAALLRCRGIPDASARLACYDGLVLEVSEVKLTAQSESHDLKQSLPPQTTEQFGLEYQSHKTEKSAIESHIPGRFEGWQANSRIRLANGQVWQISDGSTAIYDLNDPKVTIRRGMLGVFYLDIEGKNRSPKVKRLQ